MRIKYSPPWERNTPEYKLWRQSVYKRDKFKCKKCGLKMTRKGNRLNAHHIRSWANYPQLRYAVNNGITLCYACHRTMFQNEDAYIVMCINLITKPENVAKMYRLMHEED